MLRATGELLTGETPQILRFDGLDRCAVLGLSRRRIADSPIQQGIQLLNASHMGTDFLFHHAPQNVSKLGTYVGEDAVELFLEFVIHFSFTLISGSSVPGRSTVKRSFSEDFILSKASTCTTAFDLWL